MHKITKGLKKKKKGKKSKHKEEELFKPEELEAYRREHQEDATTPASEKNEEWKKFLALTSGVDDVLKKTQGDLDRIKSTSFFQRKPPPSELKRREQEQAQEQVAEEIKVEQPPEVVEVGIVEVSESESEEEEDDIFDTAYLDAITAGEVKLAYIPESPTETTEDDPFDTSIAERAILGPVSERKGKKLVSIGSAVEVLTGRAQIPTCATPRPAAARRQVLQEKNLLLGSFDSNANSIPTTAKHTEAAPKTLLDEDAPPPEEPIDLSKSLHLTEPNKDSGEDDEEFALLAAESLSKPTATTSTVLVEDNTNIKEENWAAFAEEEPEEAKDPFDTSFAENLFPGKAELKVIENEILTQDATVDFNPRIEDQISQIIKVSVTDPTGQRESISSLDRVSEAELNLIKPIHRDLLGGSNTDLSNLNDQPLKPQDKIDENYIEYCDPFDTSSVEAAKLPGQTELKFLERELLNDLEANPIDEDFNPRGERTLSRPDVLNITTTKAVSFDLPSPEQNLLSTREGTTGKLFKPLTPFYVRKGSVPEHFFEEDPEVLDDPFDTSFVSEIGPGKTELKLIENELLDPETDRRLSLSDQDFDPRDERQVKIEKIKEIAIKPSIEEEATPIDLLSVGEDVCAKVLTPAAELTTNFEDISYRDPFDTSIATNIFPGKTELKLLETELISATQRLEDPDFDPRSFVAHKSVDYLDSNDIGLSHEPLNPVACEASSFDTQEDIDPFDTSIASNLLPGKAELKILEFELI